MLTGGVLHGLLVLTFVLGVSSLEHIHHSNEALQTYLSQTSQQYPNITKLYSIGKSVEGFDLWVIAIGKDIESYVELRPHVKYIGNMHGNEVISREILLHLIEYYVTEYETNATIKTFLDNTVVHIMPTMNPDGYSRAVEGQCLGVTGRRNADNIDLNRNFPDAWHDKHQKPVAIETQSVIDWLSEYNFVLSANLHGGVVVANYPWDQYLDADQTSGPPHLTPDHDVFLHLSNVYAQTHPTMASTNGASDVDGTKLCENDTFVDGVVNGADWYPVAGGMQDYNYIEHGIFETTLEVSCCKYPNASDLRLFWEGNKEPLVAYLLEVHRGVKGRITDVNNNPISGVHLYIEGRDSVPFKSKINGEFYRMLMPGTYRIHINSSEYAEASREFTVADQAVTRVDFQAVALLSGADGSFHKSTLFAMLTGGALLSLLGRFLSP